MDMAAAQLDWMHKCYNERISLKHSIGIAQYWVLLNDIVVRMCFLLKC